MKPIFFSVLIVDIALLSLAGCGDSQSPRGFRLPDGDVTKGRAAFVQLNCVQCHTVEGEQFPASGARAIEVKLGGEVSKIKTYGQLATSIINPNHTIHPAYREKFRDARGGAMMPNFNSEMTVQQLIDLVAFLQSHYRLTMPDYESNYYSLAP